MLSYLRFSAFLALLLLQAHIGICQPAVSEALAQSLKLEANKQYETAYVVLDKSDPKDQQPDIFLQKEKLLLDYYIISLNYQGFGLKDLAPGETVDKLRGKEGKYNMHLLDIPQKLTQLRKRFPQDYRLRKGLGDYYFQARQCQCGVGGKSEMELLALVIENYEPAHAHQLGGFMSYYAVGYAHLAQQRPQPSVEPFEKSIALNPRYAHAHYNLAFALVQLQKPADALPHAQAAFSLYTEREEKADAARMLGELYKQQQQPGEAQKAWLQSLELQPKSYATLRVLLESSVASHAPDAASWAARLYQLNPADDQMFSDIMDIYQAQNQWAEAEAFFSSQLPKAPAEPTAQGLLHMYIAILNMQIKRPTVARPHFIAAQKQLKKVVKPDNLLFQMINRGLAESKQ